MKTRLSWLELVLLFAPFAALAILWRDLPAQVPMHWNLQDHVDRWAKKWPGLFVLPLAGVSVAALLHLLQRRDPKLRRAGGAGGRMPVVLAIVRVAVLTLLDLVVGVQIAASLGWRIQVGRVVTAGVLLLLAVIGNYLGNLRPNYFAGIRTPWTLEDPATWRVTHRLGGRPMFFGALVLLALQFVLSQMHFVVVLLLALAAFLLWAFLYSWNYFRAHLARG